MAEPLRALPLFGSCPAGCQLHIETTEANDPHIRAGEFAVIDPTDCEPVHGELFLVRWNGGSCSIMQTNFRKFFRNGPLWMMDPLNRPRSYVECCH